MDKLKILSGVTSWLCKYMTAAEAHRNVSLLSAHYACSLISLTKWCLLASVIIEVDDTKSSRVQGVH